MINATTQTAAVGTDGASLEIQNHSTQIEKEIKEIPIHRIKTGTQTRAFGLNKDTVDSYAADMEAGAEFPKPVVFTDGSTDADGITNHWVGDGGHRLAAAKQIGCNHIKCDVRHGNQREALRYSLSANAQHGLRRSIADKRHAVGLALRDEEWAQWV